MLDIKKNNQKDIFLKAEKSSLGGFTIIEMLVSVAIIGMISGIFLVNYRGTNRRSELVGAAQKFASDARLAQNYSLGLKKADIADANPPAGGWGIYINRASTSYVLFADKNAPSGNRQYDNGEKVREIFFPKGVTVATNGISIGGLSVPTSTIVFFPPDPLTYIKNSTTTNISIILKDQDNSTSTVRINFLGLIEVN